MGCIDEIRKNGCYDCADKVDAEDGYCQTYEAYNQALEDFAGKILDWKPQDEEYRSFKDVVNEVKEQLRK